MQMWQGNHSLHCVIDRTLGRALISSSNPHTTSFYCLLSFQPQIYHTLLSRHRRFQYHYYHHLAFPRVPSRLHRTTIPLSQATHRHLSFCPTPTVSRTMSSDDAYMAFLDKANADLKNSQSQATEQSSSTGVRTETIGVNVRVPPPLMSVDAFYVSEVDEPFEPVALKWEGSSRGVWPDPKHFSNLISPEADLSSSVETMSPASFDPKNQYPSAFRAVRAAAVESVGGGEAAMDESAVEVKVYQVEVGTSRVEYYLLALNVEDGLLVGLRAKAVET